ncbi:hypothetical protein Mapa_012270 [Marchantia paleacea]|nr:hypothetical protein Mapa_012270 [Marchantia paleacea]
MSHLPYINVQTPINSLNCVLDPRVLKSVVLRSDIESSDRSSMLLKYDLSPITKFRLSITLEDLYPQNVLPSA